MARRTRTVTITSVDASGNVRATLATAVNSLQKKHEDLGVKHTELLTTLESVEQQIKEKRAILAAVETAVKMKEQLITTDHLEIKNLRGEIKKLSTQYKTELLTFQDNIKHDSHGLILEKQRLEAEVENLKTNLTTLEREVANILLAHGRQSGLLKEVEEKHDALVKRSDELATLFEINKTVIENQEATKIQCRRTIESYSEHFDIAKEASEKQAEQIEKNRKVLEDQLAQKEQNDSLLSAQAKELEAHKGVIANLTVWERKLKEYAIKLQQKAKNIGINVKLD